MSIFNNFICAFLSCKEDRSRFRVDKYLDKKGFYSRSLTNKILQTNFYDKCGNLIIKNEYSRVGCNIVDSTFFVYNSQGLMLEKRHYTPTEDLLKDCKSKFLLLDHVKYDYDKKGNMLNIIILKGMDTKIARQGDKNKSGYVDVVDSLELLKEYLSDINFITGALDVSKVKVSMSNKMYIKEYKYNESPSILMQYGIPIDEYLNKMIIYTKDNQLIKDRFDFKSYSLTRIYSYKNRVLNKVIIETINNTSKTKAISTEKFVMTEINSEIL